MKASPTDARKRLRLALPTDQARLRTQSAGLSSTTRLFGRDTRPNLTPSRRQTCSLVKERRPLLSKGRTMHNSGPLRAVKHPWTYFLCRSVLKMHWKMLSSRPPVRRRRADTLRQCYARLSEARRSIVGERPRPLVSHLWIRNPFASFYLLPLSI